MKIYLDYVFMLNLFFDFILLITVNILLKRHIKLIRVFLGSITGSVTIFLLFININKIELILIKIVISIIMILITFGYKKIKYFLENIFYLYVVSILLGGALYALNNNFSYKKEGLIFISNGNSINIIFILIVVPILIYIYIRQMKNFKIKYSNYYNVKLYIKDNISLNLNSYLDTGNMLKDPLTKKPIILMNKKKFIYDINEFKMILVPYKTIDNNGFLRCIKVDKIDIDGIGIKKNFLLGIVDDNININGVDLILNNYLMEE